MRQLYQRIKPPCVCFLAADSVFVVFLFCLRITSNRLWWCKALFFFTSKLNIRLIPKENQHMIKTPFYKDIEDFSPWLIYIIGTEAWEFNNVLKHKTQCRTALDWMTTNIHETLKTSKQETMPTTMPKNRIKTIKKPTASSRQFSVLIILILLLARWKRKFFFDAQVFVFFFSFGGFFFFSINQCFFPAYFVFGAFDSVPSPPEFIVGSRIFWLVSENGYMIFGYTSNAVYFSTFYRKFMT